MAKILKKKFFIVAGDPSGDIHSAKLMNAMKKINSDIEFVGIGGIMMEKEGLKSLIPLSEISVVGFLEVAKKYSFFVKLLEQCKSILANEKFDAFIAVDYPGFNIKLGAFAKKNSIPFIYYIAPQLWAWGKARAKKLSGIVDLMLVVFPFEEEFFRNFGINTHFVGHPLLDDEEFNKDFKSFEEREKMIALLPGSRKQEIVKHLPLLIDTAKILKNNHSDYKFIIAKSSNVDLSIYKDYVKSQFIEITEDTRNLMLKSRIAAIKTGTSNLEAALIGLPYVMYYKTSFFTYFLAKRLINLPYISLVNILKNDFIIPELIQKDASPVKIASSITEILNDKNKYSKIQDSFRELKKLLGKNGASVNAANKILKYI